MSTRPHVEIVGDTAVVRFRADRLDGPTMQLLGEYNRPRLDLDLAEVEHLTSTAVARLVALHRRVSAAGGQLSLANVGPAIYAKLERMRLTSLFEVRRKDTGAAVAQE